MHDTILCFINILEPYTAKSAPYINANKSKISGTLCILAC